MNLDTTDPNFVADLMESQRAVSLVEGWLRKRGFLNIRIPEIRVRPDTSEINKYSDGGDIFYEERLEVKQRTNLTFTSAQDYPFRDGVIVDVCHTWDRAHPKPIAYIVINKEATHAAVIRRDSAKTWRRIQRDDRGRTREFYVAPLEVVTFIQLDAYPTAALRAAALSGEES